MHRNATTTRLRKARKGGGRFGVKTPSLAARLLLLSAASLAVAAPGDSRPDRPDLASSKPLATCSLQAAIAPTASPSMRGRGGLAYSATASDDSLVNYVRSARGEWQIPPNVDRADPWNRLLLLGPKRPLVIDIALFIDGKPYRNVREGWIDDVLTAGNSAEGDAKPAPKAKKDEAAAADKGNDEKEKAAIRVEQGEAEKKSPAAGTAAADDASKLDAPQVAEKQDGEKPDAQKADGEKPAAEKEAAEKKDEKAVPEVKVVDLQSRQAPAIRERLMNYLRTNGPSVSREEIRWMLAERGSGPPMILLGPSLSWQRSGSTPLLTFFDANGDGSLSKDEISGLVENMKKADRDVDDVLDISEIRRATQHPPTATYLTDHLLLVSIDELTNWNWLADEIVRIYGKKGAAAMGEQAPSASLKERIRQPDATLKGDGLKALAAEPADITLRVDFGAAGEGRTAGVSLLAVSPEISRVKDAVTTTPDIITIDLGNDTIEISAAGGAEGAAADFGASQIAVGAVVDGDPLLRTIDRDQNNRLTSRERDALVAMVRDFDRDGDGQAAAGEIPVPLRLAVSLGPQVHQMLARPTLSPRIVAPREIPTAPDWFVAADLNKDGDLSRSEFFGTPAMFEKFDKDGDGRLSVAEALAAEKGEKGEKDEKEEKEVNAK